MQGSDVTILLLDLIFRLRHQLTSKCPDETDQSRRGQASVVNDEAAGSSPQHADDVSSAKPGMGPLEGWHQPGHHCQNATDEDEVAKHHMHKVHGCNQKVKKDKSGLDTTMVL